MKKTIYTILIIIGLITYFTFSCTKNINEPKVDQLSVSLIPTDVTEFGGSDGSIDLTVSGGTKPYTYQWSNGSITEDINNLTADTYFVDVSDAVDQTVSDTIEISQPDLEALILNLIPTHVSIYGGSDGSINLTVNGGIKPYQYQWSNGDTTEDLVNLSAGIYSVTVSDEVEQTKTDSITILEPELPRIILDEHPIDMNFAGIHCIKVIDMDHDGDLDIVGGSEITPTSLSRGVAWWRNDGGDPITWTRFIVDESFEHVMSIDVCDIDGDSFLDIIATSWSLNQIALWKNSGNPTTGWTIYIIKSDFINAHDAVGSDLNLDGYMDIVGISSSGEVSTFIQNIQNSLSWDNQNLNNTFYGGKYLKIKDIDYDGDPDIVGSASDVNHLSWWENNGGNPISWEIHPIDHSFVGGGGIDLVDIDLDGVYDIVSTSWKSNVLAYWICNDLNNDQWQKSIITNQLQIAANPRGADFDLDGSVDIIAVGKIPGEISIYFNDNYSWSKHVIRSNFNGGTALDVIDFDNDGDLDIFGGASSLGRLYWWENKTIE